MLFTTTRAQEARDCEELAPSRGKLQAERQRLMRESPAVRLYLCAYNVAQSLGWLFLLLRVVVLAPSASHSGGEGGLSLLFRQTLAPHTWVLILSISIELLHDALGFVRVSDMSYLVRIHCKVLRRLHIFAALYFLAPATQASLVVPLVLAQWAALDLIRYPFYALNSLRACPPLLRWLRYSAFIAMYPLGIVLELSLWALMLSENSTSLRTFPETPADCYWLFAVLYVLYRVVTFPINYARMLRMRTAALTKH